MITSKRSTNKNRYVDLYEERTKIGKTNRSLVPVLMEMDNGRSSLTFLSNNHYKVK